MLQSLFVELAKELISNKKKKITNAYFSSDKVTALNELRQELAALKEAYAVVHNPMETEQFVFNVNSLLTV